MCYEEKEINKKKHVGDVSFNCSSTKYDVCVYI
jgi:hypothetical protein